MRATLGLGLAVGMMGCLSETPQQMRTRMDRESAALRQTLGTLNDPGIVRDYFEAPRPGLTGFTANNANNANK